MGIKTETHRKKYINKYTNNVVQSIYESHYMNVNDRFREKKRNIVWLPLCYKNM